jgi:hypothetical protein
MPGGNKPRIEKNEIGDDLYKIRRSYPLKVQVMHVY